ncbi:MAG: efflux RND transporter periplasmic adaptor subunit [Pseudomonadota bacterium]
MKPEPEKVAIEKKQVIVDVMEVRSSDLTLTIKAQGVVEAKNKTTLISEVSGRIDHVASNFLEGELVKKGELLIKVSDSDYQLQIQRAEASIISVQSALAQERNLARIAKQEFEWRERKNLSPAAKDAALRKPQIRAALANEEAARLEIKNARNQLNKTSIRAPYQGVVLDKTIEKGQFVSPGTPLGSIFSIKQANVNLRIPQEKLKFLNVPSPGSQKRYSAVEIYTDPSSTATQWQGVLVRSKGIVDSKTHFVNVIAEVNDPYNLRSNRQEPLRVGTFVYADIQGKTLKNVIKLPNIHIQMGRYVWIVNDQSELVRREVSIAYSDEKYSYISSGLSDGDKVSKTVLTGYLPGTKIVINNVERAIDSGLAPVSDTVTNGVTSDTQGAL